MDRLNKLDVYYHGQKIGKRGRIGADPKNTIFSNMRYPRDCVDK